MKILVLGAGGREHVLVWKLAQSPRVEKIYAAPGNPGICNLAEKAGADHRDPQALADFAVREKIDLTIVGPEQHLVDGIADDFARRELPVFGPRRAAAALEGDKSFAKDFMKRHAIPTAAFATFTALAPARDFLYAQRAPIVVKAAGLAAGKGAFVCESLAEAESVLSDLLERRILGEAGARVVIEEYLSGEEVSLLVLTDGERALPLLQAQDHKRIDDGDRGPNTGGMGAYAPAGVLEPGQLDLVMETIIAPTLRGMAAEGRRYQGVLYVGLMATAAGPKVIEYNCRFGDPEAQAVLPLLRTDLAGLCAAAACGRLPEEPLAWSPGSAVCVVLSSGGYPGQYRTGFPIRGLAEASAYPGVEVFHAGTALKDGEVVTAGGRVLNLVGVGPDFAAARERVYAAAPAISFEGCHLRRDIAWREMERQARRQGR